MYLRTKLLIATALSFGCVPLAAAAQNTSGGPQAAEGPENAVSGAAAEGETLEAIVVTGSRIQTSGFEAPTPVTTTTTEDLAKANPVSISEALVQQPQFINSAVQSNKNNTFFNSPSGTFLNLRGLGAERTLNLIDGLRIPPNTFQGATNVDVVPQLLVERVDVVTGGASAAYGSDAVSGVVNFVLDKRFEGYKISAQSGISDYGDNFNYKVSAAGGWKLGDRGHLIVAAEHAEIDPLFRGDRPEGGNLDAFVGSTPGGGPAGSPGNPLVLATNVRTLISGVGGLANTGPFAFTYFPAPGEFRPAVFGTPTGTAFAFIGGDFYDFPPTYQIVSDNRAQTAFARASYEVSDTTEIYVRGTLADTRDSFAAPEAVLGGFPQLAIYSGNAFLPAPLQAQLTATNTPSFNLLRALRENGAVNSVQDLRHWNVVAGADGSLFDGLRWDLSYSHAETRTEGTSTNDIEYRRFYAAIDAVPDPAGNVVCRVTLTNPGLYPGCMPMNLLGVGSISQESLDWVTENENRYTSENKYDSIAGSFTAELFDLPAGTVAVAAGVEWRKETLEAGGNADPAIELPDTGLRLPAGLPRFWAANIGTATGEITVKEVFGEINVPILKDQPFFDALEFNGAARYTDYETVGGATTWKAGARWAPVEDLTFRVVRSRDIRAPNLFELFNGETAALLGGTFDVHTNTTPSLRTISGGNPDLEPEVGDTFSVGVIVQPRFFPGFSASVDYYDIKIDGAIDTLSATSMIQNCELSGGTAPVCDLIIRPFPFENRTPENAPNLVFLTDINTATLEQRGIDSELAYSHELWSGNLQLRALATYLISQETQQSAAEPVIEQAGFGNFPKLRGSLAINYNAQNWGIFIQERMIGDNRMGIGAIGDSPVQNYVDSSIPAQWYTDLTLTFRPQGRLEGLELFINGRNLFDNRPPAAGVGPGPFGGLLLSIANRTVYDWIGRSYTAGVRFQF